MSKHKYSIFVSSTYEDLKEERLALMQVLLEKNFIPVGMEQFHAAPIEQWGVIKKMIDECDYYLLIIKGRYGSISESDGISYTEKEYNYAKSNGTPIIAFLPKNEDRLEVSMLDKEDIGDRQEKLKKFKKIVEKESNTVDYYEDINDLKYRVSASLDNLLNYAPRPGWIRADAFNEAVEQKAGEKNQEILKQISGVMPLIENFAVKLDEIRNNQIEWNPISKEEIDDLFDGGEE